MDRTFQVVLVLVAIVLVVIAGVLVARLAYKPAPLAPEKVAEKGAGTSEPPAQPPLKPIPSEGAQPEPPVKPPEKVEKPATPPEPVPGQPGTALKGDLNGDGKVSGRDLAAVGKYLGKKPGEDGAPEAADLNKDGIIDEKDLQVLRDIILHR